MTRTRRLVVPAIGFVVASVIAVAAIAQSGSTDWVCPGTGDYFAITETLRAASSVGAATPEEAARASIEGALTSDERDQLTDEDTQRIPVELIGQEGQVLIYGADIRAVSDRSKLEMRIAPAESGGYYLEGLRVCLS